MRKAAAAGIILAGAILVAGGLDKESGSENFVADVQANDETAQTEEETDSDPESEEEAALAAQIDTSAPVTKGSRIAVVSKSVDGEYWKALHSGMEDAIKDVNAAYGFTSDDQITMTFEGASDEQDVEKQVNTLDAVIAENPTVLCLSAGDEDSCQAQLEAARENDIAVVAFDSNVSDSDMIAVFRGTDNVYVGKMAGEKLSDAIGKSGKVAIFSAQEKTESSKKRVEGFKEALAECPDITVVQELYTDQVDDMKTAMEDALRRYPDLAGVFCTNADVSDLYLDIEKAEGTAPVMVGVDATTKQQDAVRNGSEAGIVSQSPYQLGYQTITFPVRNAFSSAASITFSVLSLSAVFCPSVPCPISAGESFFFPTIKVSASGTANAISMQTAKLPIYFG